MRQTLRPGSTLIIAVVLSFILTGCAGVGKRMEQPRVKLANIRPESFNFLETVF